MDGHVQCGKCGEVVGTTEDFADDEKAARKIRLHESECVAILTETQGE